jgi:hypothetical protein
MRYYLFLHPDGKPEKDGDSGHYTQTYRDPANQDVSIQIGA